MTTSDEKQLVGHLSLVETAQIVDYLRRLFLVGFEAAALLVDFADGSPGASNVRVAISTASRSLAEAAFALEALFPATTPPLEFLAVEVPELPYGAKSREISLFLKSEILNVGLEKLAEVQRRGSYFQDANLLSFASYARLALTECVELLDGVAKIGTRALH